MDATLAAWWAACEPVDPWSLERPKWKGSDAEAVYRSIPPEDLPDFVIAVVGEWQARCQRHETALSIYAVLGDLATAFGRAPGAWTAEQLDHLVAVACGAPGRRVSNYELPAHRMVVAAVATGTAPAALGALRDLIDAAGHPQGDTNKLLLRLRDLEVAGTSTTAGATALAPSDPWAAAASAAIGEPPARMAELLSLLSRAGSRPTAKWRAAVAAVGAADPRLGDAIRQMIAALPPVVAQAEVGFDGSVLHLAPPLMEFYMSPNSDTVRGALRAVAVVEPREDDIELLAGIADLMGTWPGRTNAMARCEKLSAAAIAAVAERGGPEAATALGHLQRVIKNKAVAKVLERETATLASASGVSAIELLERAVPDTDPAAADRQSRAAVADERARIESLFSTAHTWEPSTWLARYRHHRLTGWFGRSLLWDFQIDGAWRSGWPDPDDPDRALQRDAATFDLRAASVVRLWHPLNHPIDEIAAWRTWLTERELRQPIKQAYREIYLLTPAEQAAGDHSVRFASHLVRLGTMLALMRERRWSAKALGRWDRGDAATATRPLGLGETRACLEYSFDDHIDDRSELFPALATTGRIWFESRSGRAWDRLALDAVDPLVFSEALRDVDLFVGVSSIGVDPQWGLDRPYDGRWTDLAFAELTESGRTRRDALERLLPRLRIADRCSISDRWLEVRGDLRTYRIHLGSGNVLMAPDDQYLCIVVGRGASATPLYLPFEEGGGLLSVIVSKAVMLANDASISDRSILAQIEGRVSARRQV